MKTKVVLSFLGSLFLIISITCRLGGDGGMNTIDWISFPIITLICARVIWRRRKVFARIARPFFRRIEYLLVSFLHAIFCRFSEVNK